MSECFSTNFCKVLNPTTHYSTVCLISAFSSKAHFPEYFYQITFFNYMYFVNKFSYKTFDLKQSGKIMVKLYIFFYFKKKKTCYANVNLRVMKNKNTLF